MGSHYSKVLLHFNGRSASDLSQVLRGSTEIDPYEAAYAPMSAHAYANSGIKQYLYGQACYAYKSGFGDKKRQGRIIL